MPLLILSPAIWVTRPTIPGPMLPPRSPAMARSANIAVPPAGNFLDEDVADEYEDYDDIAYVILYPRLTTVSVTINK